MLSFFLQQDLLVLREQVDLFIAGARDYFSFANSWNLRNLAIKMVQIRDIHDFPSGLLPDRFKGMFRT